MAKVAVLIQRYYDDTADNGDNLSICGLSVFKSVSDAKKFLKKEFKNEKTSGWKCFSGREYIRFYDRENERNYYYFELYEREVKEVKK